MNGCDSIHTLCTFLNFHICSLTGTNDFRRQPCITLPCGQQPTHSPRKRSIRDAHLTHPTENVSSIRSTTLFFGSTHLRDARFCNNYTKAAPIFACFKHFYCILSINPTISSSPSSPLGTRLLEMLLLFSSNGSTHLVYAYKSHPSAQPLFETFIFIITIQKYPPKPLIFTLIFVYFLQINSLTFRLKDVHCMK